MLNAYLANGTTTSHRVLTLSLEKPLETIPASNSTNILFRMSIFFFPMALRRASALPMVNPARSVAIFMTCSW